ncbi:MAG: hypothetical protein MUO76_23725 [Anaerolineaceae bacterium]|nr:hypothetical protein [Anaerolineaceae bacterium]
MTQTSKTKNTVIGIGVMGNPQPWMPSPSGYPWFTAFGLNLPSQSTIAARRYEVAHHALEESIALNSSVGDRYGLGNTHRGIDVVAHAQGKHAQIVDSLNKLWLSSPTWRSAGQRQRCFKIWDEVFYSGKRFGIITNLVRSHPGSQSKKKELDGL